METLDRSKLWENPVYISMCIKAQQGKPFNEAEKKLSEQIKNLYVQEAMESKTKAIAEAESMLSAIKTDNALPTPYTEVDLVRIVLEVERTREYNEREYPDD